MKNNLALNAKWHENRCSLIKLNEIYIRNQYNSNLIYNRFISLCHIFKQFTL